jgi:ribosome-associated toxin RatA of RatAB toxin-antitoxin module
VHHVNRSVLVPYSVSQMYTLVADFESYPTFVPWCNDAVINLRDGEVVEGTLEMHRGGLSKHFRTRNILRENEFISMDLVNGPFRTLAGGWKFRALGEDGCKVMLELEFEFESKMLDRVLGRFFEKSCNSLVDAFVQRASLIYGPGGSHA